MRRILALALLLALPATSSAYDIAQLSKDARAAHETMIKKLGDLTIEQEASITTPGAGGTTVKTKMFCKGARWRSEGAMAMPGNSDHPGTTMETVQVFDGVDIWSVAMGMKMKLPHDPTAGQRSPSYWIDPVPGSRIAGEETVNGHDCWILEGPPVAKNAATSATAQRTWIDKKTFSYVQTESVMSGRTVRAVFSDFRKVQGFDMPYRTDVMSDGKTTMTAKIVKLETNQGLSDDLFDPAKLEGSEMDMGMGAGMGAGAGTGANGMPKNVDVDALMKQAEAMKKQMEAMQKQQGK